MANDHRRSTSWITGGVDTHLDVPVAAAFDPLGRLIGSASFTADAKGLREPLEWLHSIEATTPMTLAILSGSSQTCCPG
jgi:hypothetical protein